MRILHLDSGREMRGGQWQSLRLHQALLARGHDSMLLRYPDIRPLRLGLMSRSFDLVHAHDAHSHTLSALFARVPLVVSRRVAFPVRDTMPSQWKYRQARMFLAVSRFVVERLIAAGIGENRIRIVHDAVPLPEQMASGNQILVMPHKGQALAESAGIGVRVTRVPELDLPNARALVYLSELEGLGSGILLAMAHGVPVIASNTGGIPEIVEDGVNGVLVENNANAIRAAVTRVHEGMRAAARATVERRFTIDHMVRATLAAYEEALA